jgi:RNA polymerase sigma factor (sigma-70 family)
MLTATNDLYRKYQNLIYRLIHNHQAKYGGDWDDLLSRANERFVKACQSFDPCPERGQCKFSSWLSTIVSYGLLHDLKQKIKHQKRFEDVDLCQKTTPPKFDLEEVIKDISPDAGNVIQLIIDPEWKTYKNHRSNILINFLLDVGWAGKRIAESFQEIREVLFS